MNDDGKLTRNIAAALAHDLDGAFERFVLTYQDRIYAFALNLVGNRTTAEDVAQEAFVSAYRALQKYSPARRRTLALRTWLYTIVLNRVRNLARSPQSKVLSLDEQAREDFGMSANGSTEHAAGPAESLEREESAEELRAALTRLALRYRSAVVLRHIEERDYAEIAAILNQPVGTIKSNVHRGLALLRADLERNAHGKQFAAFA